MTRREVENFTQEDRENYLIGMMKVNFPKRPESSVNSFAISMNRTINKIADLENKLTEYRKKRSKGAEIDPDDLRVADSDEETEDAWEVGKKVKHALDHIDVDRWLRDLARDKRPIAAALSGRKCCRKPRERREACRPERADKREDPKKIQRPTKTARKNRKVLIFTAFADTAAYLFNSLKDWAVKRPSRFILHWFPAAQRENRTTFGKNEYSNILTNFPPIAKNRDKVRRP
ncbi:MAG: hypothetical protein M0C28_16895 [Candidatus Moduliflexus flocculans]|nr:hypothetical protein [Candidatus Moduliflexus flocculans]